MVEKKCKKHKIRITLDLGGVKFCKKCIEEGTDLWYTFDSGMHFQKMKIIKLIDELKKEHTRDNQLVRAKPFFNRLKRAVKHS